MKSTDLSRPTPVTLPVILTDNNGLILVGEVETGSFVDVLQGDSRSVVEAILALGKSLRLKVVGEGVENAAQLEFLRQHGCDLAQGFFFSEPVPAGQVPNLMTR